MDVFVSSSIKLTFCADVPQNVTYELMLTKEMFPHVFSSLLRVVYVLCGLIASPATFPLPTVTFFFSISASGYSSALPGAQRSTEL